MYWAAVRYTGMGLWAILGLTVQPSIILGVLGRVLGHTGKQGSRGLGSTGSHWETLGHTGMVLDHTATHWEALVHTGKHGSGALGHSGVHGEALGHTGTVLGHTGKELRGTGT